MFTKHVRLTERWLRNLLLAACVVGAGVFYLAPPAAQANNGNGGITVNIFTDTVDPVDGHCSLREAVTAANTDLPSGTAGGECRGGSSADTILLDTGTYALTGSALDVSTSMWIIGKGVGVTFVQGAVDQFTNGPRVLNISGPEVVIADLTVRFGGRNTATTGGGINHTGSGDLTLYRTEVYGNNASLSGGGIYGSSSGALNVVDSTISGNAVTGSYTLPPSELQGGGLYHTGGDLLIVNSTISDNSIGWGDTGLDSAGGGVYAEGSSFAMFYSTVSGNQLQMYSTSAFGGGLALDVSGALISHSTITGNNIHVAGTGQTAAGGGIGNRGSLTVRNSTFSFNIAVSEAEARGGGLANDVGAGSASLTQVTVTENLADAWVGLTPGIVGGTGVDSAYGSFSAANTVIAGNFVNVPGAGQCSALITFTGAAADDDSSCFTGTGAINGGTYNIDTNLIDNGGRTQTHAVGAGSALIGAGAASVCSAAGIDGKDQRLAPRATNCTIGAYEYNATAPAIPTAVADTAAVEEDPAAPLLVAAPGVLSNDTPTGLSASQTPSGLFSYSAPTGPSHAASFTLNADGSYSYTPAANFYGNDPFLYWLTNGSSYPYDMALVQLKVTGVNDPPYFDTPTIVALEDSVSAIEGLVVHDDDMADCPGAVIKVGLKVTNGTLSLGTITGLTFTIGNGTNNDQMQFYGSLTDVNAALATLTYLSKTNYNGDESLIVQLNDLGYCDGDETGTGGCDGGGDTGGGDPGGPEEITGTPVGFDVGPQNDAPVNTLPAGPVGAALGVATPIPGVSVYDVDLDTTISHHTGTNQIQVTLNVTNGTVALTASGGATVTHQAATLPLTDVVVVVGSVANVNATLASLTFTGTAAGPASIEFVTDDLGNTPAPNQTDTDVLNINVGVLLTVAASGTGSGTLVDATNGINCTVTNGVTSGVCTAAAQPGAVTYSVVATATGGSTFNGWTGCDTNTPADTCGVAPADNVTITADFSGAPPPVCPLQNCSFESPAGANLKPDAWKLKGLKTPVDGTDISPAPDGAQSLRIANLKPKGKKLYQDAMISGPAGTNLNLTFSWRGDNVIGKRGLFRVVVYLYYTRGGSGKFYINMPVGTTGWSDYSLPFTAKKPFKKIRVEIDFGKQGTAWFDNFGLTY